MKALAAILLIFAASIAGCGAPAPLNSRYPLTHQYGPRDPQFRRVMSELLGQPITSGNRVETLVNGDTFFPAMLEAVRSAEHSIAFETYIYWSGEIGQALSEALAERARAGVAVHVMIDGFGSGRMRGRDAVKLSHAGVHLRRYNPPESVLSIIGAGDVNFRTHRKLLIVDGRVGFLGGAGMADFWRGNAESPDEWRDTMYRVEGPVVAQLQAGFVDNWIQGVGQVLHGEAFFPPLEAAGGVDAQMFLSSPQGGRASMQLMMLLAFVAAETSIDIGVAYFVPDDLFVESLVAAVERGVRVRVLVPGPHTDAGFVRQASRSRWDDLLAGGVEIYEYMPTMYHCKLYVVDGIWTSVGSSNLDPRSMRYNDEANLNIYDEGIAQQQLEIFERDLEHARWITAESHASRPLLERIIDWLSSWFSGR